MIYLKAFQGKNDKSRVKKRHTIIQVALKAHSSRDRTARSPKVRQHVGAEVVRDGEEHWRRSLGEVKGTVIWSQERGG